MLFKAFLFLHMFGLAIGAGTGFYIGAVGRHAARNLDQAEARTLLPGVNSALARVGTFGLALLLVSGIGLALMMGPVVLGTAFMIKMVLVVLIVVFVGAIHWLGVRARRTDGAGAAAAMKRIGPLGPLLALLTLAAAVAAFG